MLVVTRCFELTIVRHAFSLTAVQTGMLEITKRAYVPRNVVMNMGGSVVVGLVLTGIGREGAMADRRRPTSNFEHEQACRAPWCSLLHISCLSVP